MKLLLPLDVLHPYSDILLSLERLLPLATAELTLLYVVESSRGLDRILTSAGKAANDIEKQVEGRASNILEEVSKVLKPKCRSVAIQVAHGVPAAAIAAEAKTKGCDLIALGAAHQDTSPPWLLGSTATNVVKHAQATVLILREGANGNAANGGVLVAVDGSERAANAVKTFANLLKTTAAQKEITLISIVSIVGIWKFISPVEFVASIEDNLYMVAETILADADKLLSEYGLTPNDLLIRSGDAPNEIIKAAKDIKADLIVVGAKGRSAVEQFLLGSVSNKLTMHAPCSVLVVK
jgi:nucleotide-binding universal stress UspA family protein